MLPGWIGWTLVAIIAVEFAYIWSKQRKSKANQEPTTWRFQYENRPTIEIGRNAASSTEYAKYTAVELIRLMDYVWEICDEEYGLKAERPMVQHIGVIKGEPAPDHPFVLYHTGTFNIVLRSCDEMWVMFAHEIHNVFRCQMYGPQWIYNAKDRADGAAAVLVQDKIDKMADGLWEAKDERTRV